MKDKFNEYLISADIAIGNMNIIHLQSLDGRKISQKERDSANDSDFVDVKNRAYPILKPADIPAAVHSFGRGKMPFAAFKKRLTEIAKRKGWESSLPKEWQNEKKN